ncbi:RagB/SusD family nutrient uptake outer membrane protein [Flavihumibacter sp.]|uniref:RagB/SusD family nutrient uptake outer membrane protein n=1 Tax=Flavihumibacter sp. TaxID=1913981 RepID=UPI002FCC9036
MKNNMLKIFGSMLLVAGTLVSCTKDLDRTPTNDVTSEVVYSTFSGYKQAAAKVYGAFALTGNDGPAGNPDILGLDEGTADFTRLFWKAQELSTDEAVVGWNDEGIRDFHNMNWTANNPMLTGLYNRMVYQITVANEFMRESTPEKVAARGISGADAEEISKLRAEARFLRAFQYWVGMDLFARPPKILDTDQFGAGAPVQWESRVALFDWIESELIALQSELKAPKTNETGRVDQAAAWALLSRIYLNAEIYREETTTAYYPKVIEFSKKVIDAGYGLEDNYRQLFLADNHLNVKENILSVRYDGNQTKNYGGTTFIVHASIGDNMSAAAFGVNGGWFGIRTTKNLVELFEDNSGETDRRAQFFANNLEINDISKFTDGYAVTKFKNVKRDGSAGSDATGDFVDTDFPLFRAAEMYLNYAEAALRGGTPAEQAQALIYINDLRVRAYNGSDDGKVATITRDFILDERGRELHWEGLRRTDLIRFNKFTDGSYLWPWKGGVKEGRAMPDHLRIYPIPVSDLSANPNLEQNTGY